MPKKVEDFKKLVPEDASVCALSWEAGPSIEEFPEILAERGFVLPQRELTPEGWRLESPVNLKLLEKLQRTGTPLGEYVQGRFYRGVVTGFNEAFVVDRATRDQLIAEHKSSAEVLKPFLRGRDVKRWRVEPQDRWLIFTRRGIDIKKYPAIHTHLKHFKAKLMPGVPGGRKPGSYEWYEIQDNTAFWEEFGKAKIIYPDIARECEFAFDAESLFPDCTLFLIPEGSIFLVGVLNSKIVEYFFSQICPTIRGDFRRFKSIYVSQIPIPRSDTRQQKRIGELVERILAAKKRDPNAFIGELESEIDGLVAHLYGLTEEEYRTILDDLGLPDPVRVGALNAYRETAKSAK